MTSIYSRLLIILALSAGCGVLLLHVAAEEAKDTSLHILDVGQGDAILLRSGATDVLVDGGPDATVLQRLGEVRPAWDRHVEVLVMTHPQQDHFAGFLPLLERERVGLLLLPQLQGRGALFQAFIRSVTARGIPVRFARPGQTITAGNLVLTVLAPGKRALVLGRSNPNNGGIVLRADVMRGAGGETSPRRLFSALLTADVERVAEQLLFKRPPSDLDADVLKVGHHGSKTSTSSALLRAVSPAVAIISVGKNNRYGHPYPGVLARLRTLSSVRLFRTEEQGTISVLVRRGRVYLSLGRHQRQGRPWDVPNL